MSAGRNGQDDVPVDILLVDDRPINLISLAAVLERPGYNLVQVASGNDALIQLLRRDVAVILLDVAMPGMDGFETAALIKEREQSRHIPIIFVTAAAYDIENIFRGYAVGAVDYLRKPVDPHEVRSKVAVFVELYRQRRQIERQSLQLRDADMRQQTQLREGVEAALRESEAIYQQTFEHAPVGGAHATPEGRWTKVNSRFCEILGLRRDQIVGRAITEIVASDGAAEVARAISELRGGKRSVYAGEHRLASEPARPVWGQLTLSVTRDAAGVVTRFIAIIDDVSQRKQLELERSLLVQELREAVQARDEFLSIASHELKTPMTPLRLQTASLLRELGQHSATPGYLPERLADRLQVVDRSAQRLERLIDRLLDVSRISVGRLALELEDADLTALAREEVGRLQGEAKRAGSSMIMTTAEPVLGRWDPVRLEQVISNLLANAIKYGEGKPIEVRTGSAGGRATLAVRDNGVGIPLEAQARIFERFERLAPVRRHGGFGLGLWIVRQIVEAHGGRVTVESVPGAGSEFTVDLPLRAAAAVGTRVTRAGPIALHGT